MHFGVVAAKMNNVGAVAPRFIRISVVEYEKAYPPFFKMFLPAIYRQLAAALFLH